MKFTDLGIDGFGVWSGLEIRDFRPGLNVFYGPNEAGKTTLLEFIRGVLYGFSPERRRRYLPPVRGGQAGGWLAVATPQGTFDVARSDRPETLLGETIITAADGTVWNAARSAMESAPANAAVEITANPPPRDSQLHDLLGDVDEAIFRNVFALGLEELQHLATLDGTDAARLLYGLSAGMDRVSLAEVMRELDASRCRLLADGERPSRIAELLADRDKLCGEIDELAEAANHYWRLSAERDALAAAIAEAEAEADRLDREARMLQLARALAPRWAERSALDRQLAVAGPLGDFPPNAAERFARIAGNIRKHRRRLRQIVARRKLLKTESAAATVREALWRLAPRIESLAENESWIGSVEKELQGARETVEQLETRMSAGRGRLGFPTDADSERVPDLSRRRLAGLRAPATELRRSVRAARDAKAAARQAEEEVESHAESLASALAARGLKELGPALEKAGQSVAQWRRRVQLDDRLERMTRHRADLEDETHASLDRQMLPAWMLASLGSVFVVGVLLLFAGWFLPGSFTGALGWVLSLLGIAAFGTAAAAKWILERTAARRLESCQKQLTMLESQMKQIQDERAALDKQLPSGGTPSARLQAAEADLAALEELLPLEAKRQSAEQQLPLAEREVEQGKEKLRAACEQWQAALAAAQLPKNISPKQLRQWSRHRSEVADLHQQYAAAKQQRDRIERELSALTSRIEPLFAETGLAPHSESPAARIHQLSRELAEEKTRAARRDALSNEMKALARSHVKHRAAIARLRKRGKSLLRRAGVADRAELERRAAERASAEDLARRRDNVDRELAAACTGVCDPAALAALFDDPNRSQLLDAPPQEPAEASQIARAGLHELLEQRGRLGREMESLVDDRRLPAKQLQLACVEQRLAEAIERWQVLCVTLGILQQIKEDYERKGQPETLLAASEFLTRLTGSRYQRVWTPLGESTLLVEDEAGNSLPVEVLSRGAREQLFLALRLALVEVYARRGTEMPLVLDDVLVNFDDGRSIRAAEMLRDFAAAGHQLLVFTCHERLAAVFESLGAPVRRLPRNTEPGQIVEPIAARQPQIEPPQPEPSEPKPQPPADESPPPRRRRPKPAKPEIVPEKEPAAELASNGATNGHPAVVAIPAETPPPATEPAPPAVAEALPRAAPRQRRADPPHRMARAQTELRRWSAEEFDGELEDRVRRPITQDGEAADEAATAD